MKKVAFFIYGGEKSEICKLHFLVLIKTQQDLNEASYKRKMSQKKRCCRQNFPKLTSFLATPPFPIIVEQPNISPAPIFEADLVVF